MCSMWRSKFWAAPFAAWCASRTLTPVAGLYFPRNFELLVVRPASLSRDQRWFASSLGNHRRSGKQNLGYGIKVLRRFNVCRRMSWAFIKSLLGHSQGWQCDCFVNFEFEFAVVVVDLLFARWFWVAIKSMSRNSLKVRAPYWTPKLVILSNALLSHLYALRPRFHPKTSLPAPFARWWLLIIAVDRGRGEMNSVAAVASHRNQRHCQALYSSRCMRLLCDFHHQQMRSATWTSC